MRHLCAAAAAAVLAAMPATAQAECSRAGFPANAPRAATVQGGAARTWFVRDGGYGVGCPDASAACRTQSYVTPGDVVLLGAEAGPYVCAAFTGPRGRTTAGWLPAAALSPLPERPVSVGGWTGAWVGDEQEVTITQPRPGVLGIEGYATWGGRDPACVRRGGVNVGEIMAEVQPVGDALSFTMGTDRTLPFEAGDGTGCKVRMLRRGPYLVVESNSACGGMNVTFSGAYRRRG